MTSHSCYELSSEKDHNVAQRKLLGKDFEHLGQNSVCLSCLSLPCSPGLSQNVWMHIQTLPKIQEFRANQVISTFTQFTVPGLGTER